jgi:acetyl esterase/lipase
MTIQSQRTLLLLSVCVAVLISAPATFSQEPTFANVPYVTDGGERQQLDIYLPANYRETEKLPVLVWIHGGAWQHGSKKDMPGKQFVDKGYACVSINYRLAPQSAFPAQIEDCRSAIRWVRANATKYNFDPNRIGAWGASAGGHLSSLLGTSPHIKQFDVGENLDQSSAVLAVCDIFGPTDLIVFEKLGFVADKDGVFGRLLGGSITDKHDLAVLASPMFHITKDCPPFLILHGTRDMVVPLFQSTRFYDALKKEGIEAEIIIKDGAGHDESIATPEMLEKVASFFDKYVKKEPPK